MEVRFVKLITGDEVIAEYEEGTDQIWLKNMVKIGMDQTGNMRFVGYPVVSGPGLVVSLTKSDVLFSLAVSEECNVAYRTVFGHIVEPPKTLIV